MDEKKRINTIAIGQRMKRIRVEYLGMSLAQIAQKTGVSVGGISVMELGKKKPYSVYLYALAKEFQIDINWLLTGRGNMLKPAIEIDLNYGKDNDVVQELIAAMEHVHLARYEIFQHFLSIREKYIDDIKKVLPQKAK